jgi:endonuclease/exonuclease/phosphatase family metal-dependent hydrolase
MDGCPIRVMTFNVRGSFRDAGKANAWPNRAALNVETIRHAAPDLIGFQESQSGNLDTYREALPHYDRVLGPGYGNRRPHSFNAIFFDPGRLRMLDSGGFWLSRTPERYSRSWRTRVVRSTNWVSFECPDTGLSFLHLNTHLDHKSVLARTEGSALILRKINEIRASRDAPPVVITGDFNCRPGSVPYRAFVEGGFTDAYLAAGNEDTEAANTFHAFKGSRYSESPRRGPRRIDWILLGDRIRAGSCSILRDGDEESGIYPSDHYPVIAELFLERHSPRARS